VSHKLRNLRAAREEFAASVAWYEAQQPGLGREFFESVLRAARLIQAYPEIGSPDSRGRTRRLLLRRLPYPIVYRLSPDDIVIIAIAHLKRRPDYWRRRA
jgi:plasmid stabilization system protein ParE